MYVCIYIYIYGTLEGHNGVVLSLAFAADGGRLLSGSSDDKY